MQGFAGFPRNHSIVPELSVGLREWMQGMPYRPNRIILDPVVVGTVLFGIVAVAFLATVG